MFITDSLPRRILGTRFKGICQTVFLVLFSIAIGTAHADQEQGSEHITRVERAKFLLAERLLRTSVRSKAQHQRIVRIVRALEHYPLTPYLQARLVHVDDAAVLTWLMRHPNAPFNRQLRMRWLKHLAQQEHWMKFLAYFPDNTPSDELRCLKAQALIAVNRRQAARQLLAELWRVERSQPAFCDAPFRWWQEEGGLSEALIWDRITLAMKAGNGRLAKYLTRRLSVSTQQLVSHWDAFIHNPKPQSQLLTQYRHEDQERIRYEDALLHGFQHWMIKKPLPAAITWRTFVRNNPVSSKVRQDGETTLGLSFAREHNRLATSWLFQPYTRVDGELLHWRVITAAYRGDWKLVLWALNDPYNERANSDFVRYWKARAWEQTGRIDEAFRTYTALAGTRSYYGFLAADRARMGYTLGHQTLKVDAQKLRNIANSAAIRRAKEFLALGRNVSFRREWNALVDTKDEGKLLALAQYASEQGWNAAAIRVLMQARKFNDLKIRYPLAYQYLIERVAQREGLNPAWIYAVIRQESTFSAQIRSRAGASGLMQLMPATALELGKKLGISPTVYEPANNIRLGGFYLRTLCQRFSGHKVLASAAYNAGASRVRRWLAQNAMVDADIWIDRIPFRETRRYIKRVLANYVIYTWRLTGKPISLDMLLPPIPSIAALKSEEPDSPDCR